MRKKRSFMFSKSMVEYLNGEVDRISASFDKPLYPYFPKPLARLVQTYLLPRFECGDENSEETMRKEAMHLAELYFSSFLYDQKNFYFLDQLKELGLDSESKYSYISNCMESSGNWNYRFVKFGCASRKIYSIWEEDPNYRNLSFYLSGNKLPHAVTDSLPPNLARAIAVKNILWTCYPFDKPAVTDCYLTPSLLNELMELLKTPNPFLSFSHCSVYLPESKNSKPCLKLHNLNLEGADFRNSILPGLDVKNTNLKGANFKYATIQGDCSFERVDGRNIQFDPRGMEGDFHFKTKCNFAHANFQFEDFTHDKRIYADDDTAIFHNAKINCQRTLSINLSGIVLPLTSIRYIDIHCKILNFCDAYFINSAWSRMNIQEETNFYYSHHQDSIEKYVDNEMKLPKTSNFFQPKGKIYSPLTALFPPKKSEYTSPLENYVLVLLLLRSPSLEDIEKMSTLLLNSMKPSDYRVNAIKEVHDKAKTWRIKGGLPGFFSTRKDFEMDQAQRVHEMNLLA